MELWWGWKRWRNPSWFSGDGVAEIRSGGRSEEKEWENGESGPGTRWPVLSASVAPLETCGLAPTARSVRLTAGFLFWDRSQLRRRA